MINDMFEIKKILISEVSEDLEFDDFEENWCDVLFAGERVGTIFMQENGIAMGEDKFIALVKKRVAFVRGEQ